MFLNIYLHMWVTCVYLTITSHTTMHLCSYEEITGMLSLKKYISVKIIRDNLHITVKYIKTTLSFQCQTKHGRN